VATKTTRFGQGNIDPQRWDRLKTILGEALEQSSSAARTALVERRCGQDTDLLEEAESLLAEAEALLKERTDRFEDCAQNAASTLWQEGPPRAGERVGAYVIVRELGRGGMGTVFLAERADGQFEKQVAIKILSRDADTAEILRRFRGERQILARLDHPNIARLLDAGTTDDSLPYFIMDYIVGAPVTRFAVAQSLSTRQRLELFLKICGAVEFAHRNLVVHRDIKPSNILANAEGEPKLLDFGIAKILAKDEAAAQLTTQAQQRLTPICASPEQAKGDPITVATDIYSLGALLYEMLSGQRPHRFSTARPTREELALVVGEQVPPPPSAVASDAQTARLLRGDLDAIVLFAMHKEPEMRYATVADLAADIRRHLARKPVVARHATLGYHAKCLVKRNGSRLVTSAAVVMVLAGVLFAFWARSQQNAREAADMRARGVSAPASDIRKSIAVLPFQNLSSDPDNAYFADGIQEEVLTCLAKIADLKVISRTSTQGYQSEPSNLAEIAKQLGVANILEGSVQKAANQVRVNVHLVNVQTGSQLWAETYDRKLSDIFSVESEIAKGIAESLQAKLTGREEQALAVKPTNNPQAYDAYLRGLAFEARGNYSSDALFKAIDFYDLAVRLDPNFALAWARLSGAHALLYVNRVDTTAARRNAAREALKNAQRLQPNTPETLLFTGYYQYWVLHDYGLAKATFGRVSKMLPSNSEVLYALAAIARSEGHWDESVAYWERGLALNPRNTALLTEVAFTYAALRQFPAAEKLYDRALNIFPDELSVMALKASVYQAEGNLQEAAKSLMEVNAQTNSDAAVRIKLTQLRLERNPEGVRWVQARKSRLHVASGIEKGSKQVGLALAQRVAGDTAHAKADAEQARNTLESLKKDQPDNAFVAAALAVAYAMLDEKDSALNEAQRAIMLLPSIKDRLSGPAFEENLALVEMMIGENNHAIATLTRLLQTPYGGWLYSPTPITPALLKLDPIWDPLRADPDFQRLCEQQNAREAAGMPARGVSAPASDIRKSIAVLPFDNLGDNNSPSYFADGVQDNILTDLGKVGDLKVISRSGVAPYRGKNRNMKQIGRDLGVANVLEGSVQISGNRVRINAQLIDTQTDTQVWAEQYDRKLEDIFALQSELAQTIAAQLKVTLSTDEKAEIWRKPTQDLQAYDLYLRARAALRGEGGVIPRENWNVAVDLLDRAIARDPKFTLAYCLLNEAYVLQYRFGEDHSPQHLAAAKDAAETALRLEPNREEARLALARYYYHGLRDYRRTQQELSSLPSSVPHGVDFFTLASQVERRLGQFAASIRDGEKAVELDPQDASLAASLGQTYYGLRRFRDSERVTNAAIARLRGAKSKGLLVVKSEAAVGMGNLEEAHAALDSIQDKDDTDYQAERLRLYLIEREYSGAKAFAAKASEQVKRTPNYWLTLAAVFHAEGKVNEEGQANAEAKRSALLALGPRPDDARLLSELAIAEASLGQNEEALRHARHAAEMLPPSVDAVGGAMCEMNLVAALVMTGDRDATFDKLSKLVKLPFGLINYGDLKLNPVWDDLRDDPRFDRILTESALPLGD
jgi:eukaryotic-like serine/threonine-protein kinase